MSTHKKKSRVAACMILIAVIVLLFVYILFFESNREEYYNQAAPGDIKVACVGDSITYGEHIVNRKYSCYPAQLRRMLGNGWNVRNFGVSGSTVSDESESSYRQTESYRESLEYEPDIVILMIGTNDTKPQNWKNIEFFQKQYQDLLESYLVLKSKPEIYVCTPASAYFPENQDMEKYAYHIRPEFLEDEISVIRGTAGHFKLQVIDIHKLTAGHREWFQQDGIHPLRTGAKAIAETVKDTLKQNMGAKEEK